MLFGVHLLPVVVVAALNIALAMLYYSPKVLGKTWMDASNVKESECCKSSTNMWVGCIAVSLITAWVIALAIHWVNPINWLEGITTAFIAWLLVAAQHLSAVIWNKKPIQAYIIDAGWQLLSFLVMGSIFTFWR